MLDDRTYLYKDKDGDHVEVELTGRTASEKLPAIGSAKARENKLVQIKPVDLENGTWKRFVSESKLLTIDEE